MKIERFSDGLELTSEYWDCECDFYYIHNRSKKVCEKCGAKRDDCPDSRVGEGEQFLHRVTGLSK